MHDDPANIPHDPRRRHGLKLIGRAALASGAMLAGLHPLVRAQDDAEANRAAELLRRGGCIAAFRHAYAPGTYDPPGYRLDDCASQRNLDDRGRAQARHLGQWFASNGLKPATVRSSPFCRCLETATLAFGDAEAWDALSSPLTGDEARNRERMAALSTSMAQMGSGRFGVWVTHQFVLSALARESTQSAEGLILQWQGDRAVIIGRLAPA